MSDVVDLMTLDPGQTDVFYAGYRSGWRAGIERGREVEREDLARIQRAAVAVVHRLAERPSLGQELSAEGAAEREAAGTRRFRDDHALRQAARRGGERQ